MKTIKNNRNSRLNLNGLNKTKFGLVLILSLTLITQLMRASGVGYRRYDSTSCLIVEGEISNIDQDKNGNCQIKLITNNTTVDSIVLKKGDKKFRFILDKNKNYSILISKKGYVNKLVSVDTKIIKEMNVIFQFEFSTILYKQEWTKYMNRETLDWPSAIIYFDCDQGYFSYDKRYTSQIKNKLLPSK